MPLASSWGLEFGNGYSVNILSASRRRERIVVVFETYAAAAGE